MNVTIFGASGRIGSLLVAEMLHRGHKVTAFVYGPDHFKPHPKLKVLRGDIHEAADVKKALQHADAVMSALGSWGTPTKDILSSAMRAIVPIMQDQGIKRIVSLTGADARDLGDKPNLFQELTHAFFGLVAGKIMHDGEEHIKTLRHSELDWTVLRSPVMSDKGKHGKPKLRPTLPMPWETIHRKDVVKAMCDLVESRFYVKQSPVIYRD